VAHYSLWIFTNISDEAAASFIRIQKTSTLEMEAACFSEMYQLTDLYGVKMHETISWTIPFM
jgi:hypothetical protein